MPSKYPELASEHEITQKLEEMGVDVYHPESRFEESMAEAFSDFSSFVLSIGKERCLEILENDLYNDGGSVGELQGGDDSFSIYRVSFPEDEITNQNKKCKNAAAKLLEEYDEYSQRKKRYSHTMLTFENIKQYMLSMCDRRSAERCSVKYTSLGNLMFILCFGEAAGQVRHIDNMVPNLQICLYMSELCPSTIVYEMDEGEGSVIDVSTLIDLWNRQYKSVPQLIVDILLKYQDTNLKSNGYTKYFSFWKTINSHLQCFGKLYQQVLYQHGLQTDPGTTLLAGGNEVHAGPPTTGPRMFAFAVGIPDLDGITEKDGQDDNMNFQDDDNDGEVQYSPVLLHIDFCYLLFSLLDYDCDAPNESVVEAKRFLVEVLADLIRDYPMREYLRQINEDRRGTRDWLDKMLQTIDQEISVRSLIDVAIHSHEIFYSPDVVRMNSKKKRKGRQRASRTK